jgi:WS/DGAT/MGAT family acyltransferase
MRLLGEALKERVTSPTEIYRGFRAALRGPRQVLRGLGATSKMVSAGMSAPDSVFNVEIGPHRRFQMTQADLNDLKRVKDAHGGTVNDVILSIVAGALGKYLRARGHDTEGLELRAMVPVSVRATDEHGALGNRITAMFAPLPVWCEDPVERLHLMSAEMGDLKSSGQAVGAEILTKLTDFAPSTIASQAARLQPAQRFFNLVVTNVPGPQFPLYVLGRKMESIFPMVPLARRQALCIGIMSYNGQVNFGLVGDYDGMAGLDSFALDLEAATQEVMATVPKTAAKKKAKKSKAKAAGASSNGAGPVATESRS